MCVSSLVVLNGLLIKFIVFFVSVFVVIFVLLVVVRKIIGRCSVCGFILMWWYIFILLMFGIMRLSSMRLGSCV